MIIILVILPADRSNRHYPGDKLGNCITSLEDYHFMGSPVTGPLIHQLEELTEFTAHVDDNFILTSIADLIQTSGIESVNKTPAITMTSMLPL